jgi:hypothetical protein
MKSITSLTLVSLLILGLFLNQACSSSTKHTETLSMGTTEEKIPSATVVASTEVSKAAPADLGATSAGRSR